MLSQCHCHCQTIGSVHVATYSSVCLSICSLASCLFSRTMYEFLPKHSRRYSCGVYVMWWTLILILSLNFINHTRWCPVLANNHKQRESKEFSPISIVSIFVTMKPLWSERNLRKILIQIIKYFKIQQTMNMHPQRWPATKSVRVQRVNYNALCT